MAALRLPGHRDHADGPGSQPAGRRTAGRLRSEAQVMPGDPISGDTSVLPAVDAGDAVRFLQQLVRLDTVNPPGHESRAADLIEARLAPRGLAVERLGAEPG